MNEGYDLFVSYSPQDDHDGWVSAIVENIRREHAQFTPEPLLNKFILLFEPKALVL